MMLDVRELHDFLRRASDLRTTIADVPTVLDGALGSNHRLTVAAHDLQTSVDSLVRELQRFDLTAQESEVAREEF